MEIHEQQSGEAHASRMKFVWPAAELTGAAHPSEPRLTLTGAEFGKTMSPKDLLDRLSREFRKSDPPLKGPEPDASPSAEPVPFPNTELALRTRPSLFGTADDLLASVFAQSLARVGMRQEKKRKEKTERKVARDRHDAEFRRRMFPLTADVRLTDNALYSAAAIFVDRLLHECERRALAVDAHRIRRLRSYKTPDEFSIDDGVELVLSWLGRWRVNRYWCVKVLYAGRNLAEDRHAYYFTARLSVPTLPYPAAQVTCDVNFDLDVNRMAPPPVHVEVWYRIETDRSRHSALADPFNREWIENVIRWKLRAFKTFNF